MMQKPEPRFSRRSPKISTRAYAPLAAGLSLLVLAAWQAAQADIKLSRDYFVDEIHDAAATGDAAKEPRANEGRQVARGHVQYPRNLKPRLRIVSDFHSWTGVWGGRRKMIHQGIDIVGRSGQPIIAIADGRVVETHVEKCWGPTVVIDHGRDKHGKRLIALYGHVGKILVREGQAVSRGDLVARLGDNHRRFKCMVGVRHLHLQLGRIRRLDKGRAWGHAYFLRDSFDGVNPHLLWADGPNRVTCFEKDRNYPRGTLTYPVPCRCNATVCPGADIITLLGNVPKMGAVVVRTSPYHFQSARAGPRRGRDLAPQGAKHPGNPCPTSGGGSGEALRPLRRGRPQRTRPRPVEGRQDRAQRTAGQGSSTCSRTRLKVPVPGR